MGRRGRGRRGGEQQLAGEGLGGGVGGVVVEEEEGGV